MDMVSQLVAGMTLDEKRALLEELRAAIAEDLAGLGADAGGPARCPRCGCARVVRKGRGRDGSQRWACRGCGRTFCARTMSLLGQSKLPAWKWARLAWDMVAGKALRECAADCGVCLRTAWFMRMRACEVMGRRLEPFRAAGGRVEVDGTFLDESLSGNRSMPGATPMPRPARRSGGVRVRGVSDLKLCVICAANDLGDVLCQVAARGRARCAEVEAALRAAGVGEGTTVATDRHGSYPRAVAALGAELDARKSGTPEAAEGLALVNALHGRLKAFLRPFFGVSSRWLQHYLWWFEYADQHRVREAACPGCLPTREERLAADQARGHYDMTRREMVDAPQPFWGFWEGEVPDGM